MNPWYKVAIPRKEVREGRSFNPDEFAIHLEQVMAGTAPEDYKEPDKFFSRTCFTRALREHAGMVLRRLSGETANTAPVLTLVTQFGGGKTHTLTALYHLANNANKAAEFQGVSALVSEAGISSVPEAKVAAFVGNAWDPREGRETPWIDIARQLAGDEGVKALGTAAQTTPPGTEALENVFRAAQKPVLILFDEVLNFLNRHRNMADSFHSFIQNLTVATTATTHGAAIISLPRSQVEMTDWDMQWQNKITKVVRRVAKDLIANDETEISEVVRRRLFQDIGHERLRKNVAKLYADWCFERRAQLPSEWTAIDSSSTEAKAREYLQKRFELCYPFHPATLSVFQRKWQMLQQYQQTRGTLAMLAQWISWAYKVGYTSARTEPLITLGSAPLHVSEFRSIVLGQVGESRLGAALDADIAGAHCHAGALDADTKGALNGIHRRVGVTVFFESTGGQTEKIAHLPELRFALGEPEIDTTSVDNAAFALEDKSFFIRRVGSDGFKITHQPTMKKVVSDRRASLDNEKEIIPAMRSIIQKEFDRGATVPIVPFPADGASVQDTPKLTLVTMDPESEWTGNGSIRERIAEWSRHRGSSPRLYPGSLVWCLKKPGRDFREKVELWLAWKKVAKEIAEGTLGGDFDKGDRAEIQTKVVDSEEAAKDEVRGGKSPRIKRLSEYIGQSYFDYLAGLDDLVMLMDESHRYRASAGVRAINELNPILGLELTATPQVERGQNTESFKNVIYSYPLSSAMNDGFVKEPAVATRENFDAANYSVDGLEKVKLEDGVRIHENTKVELEVYARNNGQPIVKPFMLVVAQDTTHANALQQVMENDDFFDGRYKGRVITVHSNVRGEEKDEVVEQLLNVENSDNPVEAVIHVNMLKEGWDVTNLYTIVPLRAANSRTLVEQSIGRGLRLPFGKRVGVPAVDRLTIVSHDRFQEIIDHANDPNSIIRTGVIIGKDIPEAGKKAVIVESEFEKIISIPPPQAGEEEKSPGTRSLFEKPEEQEVAKATFQVIRQYERLRGTDQLQDAEIQEEIIKKVEEIVRPKQGKLFDSLGEETVAKVVADTTGLYEKMSIDIPKIVVVPKGEVVAGYKDFDLDTRNINLQPVAQDILIQHLHDMQRYKLRDGSGIVEENRPEDYLVRGLIDFNDISYDDHAALLYKLAGQVVAHLRSYLSEEDDVVNVLQYHQQALVNLIHSQMQGHFTETAASYEAHVTKGFRTLRPNNYTAGADQTLRDFRTPIPEGEKNRITNMLFGGFQKCLYSAQKFDSDPERRFAVILENDEDVLKWFKPAKGDFQIHYSHDESYEPDFVVETATGKFLCEPKRASEVSDDVVQSKADAAAVWCEHATVHAKTYGGKPWTYLLIPHDQVSEQMSLAGLAARCTHVSQVQETGSHGKE